MKQINKKYRNTTVVANQLVSDNINIVYKVLYDKFRGTAHDTILSVAFNELLDAAYRYDTNSKVKFSTYAYSCVYFKLLEILKKEKTYQESILLQGDFTNEEEMSKEIKDFLSRNSRQGGIDTDFDGLQTLADLGLYEMGWEMQHQELKGGRNVKPKDYKQQKVVKREDSYERKADDGTSKN